ncbi:30S ribosomal protein S9 [Candidatus Woesearchaeota archaeon]|nr:30S ribosomal protein S9 [Candidatus Woesearchaeota archaeon]
MTKIIVSSGKRKRAIARAVLKSGKGKVRINGKYLDVVEPEIARMKIMEPLILATKLASMLDIDVVARGGGFMAQAEAARLAVARGLLSWSKDEKLRNIFLNYDRHLLVADVRRREMRKPNDSRARAHRQKSYR